MITCFRNIFQLFIRYTFLFVAIILTDRHTGRSTAKRPEAKTEQQNSPLGLDVTLTDVVSRLRRRKTIQKQK